MNATIHSELSAKRWGGQPSDYYQNHDLIDCSKEIESTNLHRAASHSIFWVKNVWIPIIGATFKNSDGRIINTKDFFELDHLLPDYSNRFIPTLGDFVDLCSDAPEDKDLIETFHQENQQFFAAYPEVKILMLEPLFNTGKLKSLLLTHNSWFICKILPLIFKTIKIELKNYNIEPNVFFNRCRYADWLDNGRNGFPKSFAKIEEKRKKRLPKKVDLSNAVVDGSRGSFLPGELKD